MASRLIWSPEAIADLDAICAHIAKDSEHYACVFAEAAVELAEQIEKYPKAGRIVPEYRRASLRERIFQEYRVVYQVTRARAEIVAIVHGARVLPRALKGRRLS